MMMMIWFRGPQPSAPFKEQKYQFANDSFASKEDDGRRRGGCQSRARPSPLVLDRIIIIFARLVASVGGGVRRRRRHAETSTDRDNDANTH